MIRADFFNSKNGDRNRTANDFAERFKSFFSNGVIVKGGTQMSSELKVALIDNSMKVEISNGIAVIEGYTVHFYDSKEELTLDSADPSSPRIDRVILELNLNDDVRSIVPKIKKGMPAVDPKPPQLIRNKLIYQLSLAQISVPANVTKIPKDNLIDERGDKEVCGIANVIVGVNPPDGNDADTIVLRDTKNNFDSTNVEDALEELFTHVNNGKQNLETAIIDKKAEVSKKGTIATFSELEQAILSIRLGSGNAEATQVLEGITFTNDSGIEQSGNMPNRGGVNQKLSNQNQVFTIPKGYHNGLGKVKAVITGLIASVIKAGTTVGGILGTFTSDATAAAGEILSGKTAYVNGTKITGTIPSKGSATITPGTSNQTISAGQYLSGIQTIQGDPDLIAENIKSGKNIFGVDGTSGQVVAGSTYKLVENDGVGASGSQAERWAMICHGISGTIRFKFTGLSSKSGYVRTYYIKVNNVDVSGALSRYNGTSDPYTWTIDVSVSPGDRVALWAGTTGGQARICYIGVLTSNFPPIQLDA